MDTLAVTRSLDLLEKERPLVILPPFYYGAASYAVAKPERKGSVHVDAEAIMPFAKSLFHGLLRVGFRNIYGFVHHQTENFAAGMPTDLSFKFAARKAIFEWIEAHDGEGWWGENAMADYYTQHAEGSDPFNWIKIHPLMTPEIIAAYPFDHAGIGETSLMMALCPDGVAMDRHDPAEWYSASARDASRELGERGRDLILSHMRKILWG
jgi:creatinine amidohydrolase